MYRIILILVLFVTGSLGETSFLSLFKHDAKRIVAENHTYASADLISCNSESCHRVKIIKITTAPCDAMHLPINFDVKLPPKCDRPNESIINNFNGFLTPEKGLVVEQQTMSAVCILLKQYYVNKDTQIVVVDDVLHITPNKQADRVITVELIKQFRFIMLVAWKLGYYNAGSDSIQYMLLLKVYFFGFLIILFL